MKPVKGSNSSCQRIFFGKLDYLKIYQQLKEPSSAFDSIIRYACKNPIALDGNKVRVLRRPQARSSATGKGKGGAVQSRMAVRRLKEKINQLLNQGKPIAVSYDVSQVSNLKGGHVSLAREWRNNRCEYKIRNSWGKTCHSCSSGVECIQEEGSFWLSDEKFFQIMTTYTYLE
jgi:hypothetical protein